MTDAAPKALEARFTVSVGRGKTAFQVDVGLTLCEGVLVFFGPSGAGKSLTLQALAGLTPKGAPGIDGFLRVAGETIFDSARRFSMPAHARRIGYVPQQHALFPFLDVAGNVAFGLPRSRRRGKCPEVDALLDELGLRSLASARPAMLSGGERQRVALGRALAVEPRLLLLDEPFASIDSEGRVALWRLLRAVIDRRRIPAVLVTHDAAEAVALGDTLVRFERGKTAVAGDPRALLGLPRRVVVTGTAALDPDAAGDNLRLVLRDAVIEGPSDLIPFAAGDPVRLVLEQAVPRG